MVTVIEVRSNAVAANRTHRRVVGEKLFPENSFTTSLPRFGVLMSMVEGGGVDGRSRTTTQREPKGFLTFLGYKPVAFHPN
jgi:hypothetical protein